MVKGTTNTGLNLTRVTFFGRRFLKYGVFVIIGVMVGRFALSTLFMLWQALNPPAPPPPTIGFGLLPPLVFPNQTQAEKPGRYKLETATGTLPNFGDRAKVFFMPPQGSSLLDDQEAKTIATGLGFVFEPQILDATTYRWTKSQPLQTTLNMNIKTKTFVMTTDFLNRPDLIRLGQVPDSASAVTSVKQKLNQVGLLQADIATRSGEISFLKTLGGELAPAISLSEAEVLRVDLSRAPIDGQFEMYTPDGKTGTVVGFLATKEVGIVELRNNHHLVDYSQVETYPLRTAQDAWQVLQAGEGFIASKGITETAVIRKVYLGYFDAYLEQSYLQPIYVFEGDDGFLGYVSAVEPKLVAYQIEKR